LWEEVNTHLHYPWEVRTLAARLHLSRMQFHRQVLRYHGVRPMEMVTHLRMLRAKSLLRNTDDTLSVIASSVGYQTPFALSRVFRKHVGISPREYRSQRLKK
jgi:AraC-like DNA-binding protein